MTGHDEDSAISRHSATKAEGEALTDDHAPKLSRRAQEALKKADPLTEGILAKVLGNQVSLNGSRISHIPAVHDSN